MSLWTKVKPPMFFDNCEASHNGWINKKTGEILVAIRQLTNKRLHALDETLSQITLENGSGFVTMEQTVQSEGYKPNYIVKE